MKPAHCNCRDCTQPLIFSADETADVGVDDATPVTEDYKARNNAFTGKILKGRFHGSLCACKIVDEVDEVATREHYLVGGCV
jgi:hypothetical protein